MRSSRIGLYPGIYLLRRSRTAVDIAYRLGREHRDWTWTRIANEARRQAGLGPLRSWEME